jgi:hypothetical protein
MRRSLPCATKPMPRLSAALFLARVSERLSAAQSVAVAVPASGRPRVRSSAPGSVPLMPKTRRATCSSSTTCIMRSAWRPGDPRHRRIPRRRVMHRRQGMPPSRAIHRRHGIEAEKVRPRRSGFSANQLAALRHLPGDELYGWSSVPADNRHCCRPVPSQGNIEAPRAAAIAFCRWFAASAGKIPTITATADAPAPPNSNVRTTEAHAFAPGHA